MIICPKEKCTGCYACINACPYHCITMQNDSIGILHPTIDDEKCIHCNLCIKSCPNNCEFEFKSPIKCYATWTKDKEKRKKCASGGIATVFSEYIIKQKKGVVYGTRYTKDLIPITTRSETLEDLEYFKGSKYTQSLVGECFKDIKKDLDIFSYFFPICGRIKYVFFTKAKTYHINVCLLRTERTYIMKKNFLLLFTLLLLALVGTGCGDKVSGSLGKDGAELVGTWNGVGNALGRDDSYSCDYLSFSIDKEGTFTLKDIAQNKTCLSGSLSAKSEKFSLDTREETTAELPSGWDGLGSGSTLSYDMPTKNKLILTYDNVSYLFEKQNDSSKQTSKNSSASPLLNLAENDVWYSNDGSNEDKTTYELSLYDNYMELYSIDPKAATEGEATFLTNFFYLSSRDNEFTFYTYKEASMKLPDFLKDLPDGFSKSTITMKAEDDSITLSYNGKSLSFYNNVIYGLKSDSDSYRLCDTCFNWKFDSSDHFSYFTMNPDTNTLYLYVTDGAEDADEPKYVAGEVHINEKKHTITYHFDKDLSEESIGTDSNLYKIFEKMDKTKLSYTLKDKQLTLKLDKTTYKLTLDEY